jgi:recombination protein RecA
MAPVKKKKTAAATKKATPSVSLTAKKPVKKKKKVVAKATRPKAKLNVDDLIELSTNHFGGRQVMFRATEAPSRIRYRIPTSSLVLNRLLAGGVCVPRITQFYGPSGVFKSTGVYDVIGNAQAMGLRAVLCDTESAADESYMEKWDIDSDALGYIPADVSADDVVEQIIMMLQGDKPPEVIAIDSLTGLLSNKEKGGWKVKGRKRSFIDEQNSMQGWAGKFNSIAFKHINHANKGTTAVIFTNQMRESIGEMVKATRNQGRTKPTGGLAQKYYSSDIVYMEHEAYDWADEGKKFVVPIGTESRERRKFKGWIICAQVEKTRTSANENMELFFRFWPETAEIDHIGEIMDLGRADGLIETKGAYYKYEGKNIGQGMLQARKALIDSRLRSDEAISEGERPVGEIYFDLRCLIEEKSSGA